MERVSFVGQGQAEVELKKVLGTSRSRSNVFECPIDTVDHEKTFEVGGLLL